MLHCVRLAGRLARGAGVRALAGVSAGPGAGAQRAAELQGVELSARCAERLKELCRAGGTGGSFLRLAVEGGGCSGFQYKFQLDNIMHEDDRVFERDGAKLVIDETSLDYVRGSTIDYHTELIRSTFRVVTNPNADLGCSCGASFSIKIE